jgi:hypothetical protein
MTQYQADGAGKDLNSVIDVGINPDHHIPESSNVLSWSAAGEVSIGFGNDP